MATRQQLNDYLIQSPLHQWLGCEITCFRAERGEVTVHLPFRREFLSDQDAEAAHGGIVATLIDLTAHAAVHAAIGVGVPTVDLKVDFLRPALLPLEAKGLPRRVGRTISVVDVDVFSRAGELAAVGRAIFALRESA